MSNIEFQRVYKKFTDTYVVDDFSLTIDDGEFVALVGPSGCGKTTTLRMLAGLETPTFGSIQADGKELLNLHAKDRNLAMVFQSYALYPHLSVEENIAFSLKIQRIDKPLISKKIKEASEMLKISEYLKRKPKELSGGQRQRVALARCIVREPQAFLFDEPLSNLDAKLRASARAEIAQLQRNLGITSIYVTHDQIEAMTMADRVVIMNEGKIIQYGPPMELYNEPKNIFVATFLGSPEMNLIKGCVKKSLSKTEFLSGDLRIKLDDKIPEGLISLGIRPEVFSLKPSGEIKFNALVNYVEHLGAETVIEFIINEKADGHISFKAKLQGTIDLKPKSKINLFLKNEDVHIFNEIGERINEKRRRKN